MNSSISRTRLRVDGAKARLKAGWRGQRGTQDQGVDDAPEMFTAAGPVLAEAPETHAVSQAAAPLPAAEPVTAPQEPPQPVAAEPAPPETVPEEAAPPEAAPVTIAEPEIAPVERPLALAALEAEAISLETLSIEARAFTRQTGAEGSADPVLAKFAPPEPEAAVRPAGRIKLPPAFKRPSPKMTRRALLAGGLAAGAAGLAIGLTGLPGGSLPRARTVATASLENVQRAVVEPLFDNEIDYLATNEFPDYPRPEASPTQLAEAQAQSQPKPAAPHVAQSRLFAERRLALYNENTGEGVNALYWADGEYVLEGLEAIQVLLRDHRAGEIAAIDLSLVDSLNKLGSLLDAKQPFHILSAYRTRKTNEKLSEVYSGVAVNSFHMKGKAVDIRLPGRAKRDLLRAALEMKAGGVGNYRSYIHFDTGPVRRWSA